MTVPDSGVRDEHGMEPIENLFSSPAKSDHEEQEAEEEEEEDEYGSGEEAMDITTSTHSQNVDHDTHSQGLSSDIVHSIRDWAGSAPQRAWE